MTIPGKADQRKLLFFLSVASFFEGYDFIIVTQILPHLRAEWQLDRFAASMMLSAINVGTIAAFFVVRYADRIGRRRMLLITIMGYTVATIATGFATDPVSFTIAQFIARVFLTAEWATCMVYAAEEFPKERRATMIGIISACASLGAIVCAGAIPLLLETPWGWRTAYFLAAIPLVLIAYARRNLKESRRFAGQLPGSVPTGGGKHNLTHIWTTPYRRRLVQMSIIWACAYVCSNVAIQFWADFAFNERNLTTGQIGTSIAIAALGSTVLLFFVGRMLDKIGRRLGTVLIFSICGVGIFLSYTFFSPVLLTIALFLAILGLGAYLPLLNTYTTELFPTHIRSDAFAWSNNLLGRITYVIAPLGVGFFAASGWADPVRFTVIFLVTAMLLILWWLPETKNRELEETSAIPERHP
jgi:MFS transporter, putative metabolite:H+ symporter